MKASFEKVPPTNRTTFVARRLALPVFDHPYHFHPEIELTFIESGSGRRFVGDCIEPFAAGDLVLLGPNLPHLFYTAPADSRGPLWARATVIQFRQDAFGAGFFELPDMATVRQLFGASIRGLHFSGRTVGEIGAKMAAIVKADGVARTTGLLDLLERLAGLRGRPLSSRTHHPEMRFADMDRMDRVVALVHQRFREEIFLADAAKAAALTPEAFCRFFKRSTGRTFSRFVNDVRIAETCRLLMETDRPISEIAFSCGFGTLSNFNQRFTEISGTTPRAYRQSARTAGLAQTERLPRSI